MLLGHWLEEVNWRKVLSGHWLEEVHWRKVLLGHWLEEVEKVPQLEVGVGLEMEARD